MLCSTQSCAETIAGSASPTIDAGRAASVAMHVSAPFMYSVSLPQI